MGVVGGRWYAAPPSTGDSPKGSRASYAELVRRAAKRRLFSFLYGYFYKWKRAAPGSPHRGTLAGVFPARILRNKTPRRSAGLL